MAAQVKCITLSACVLVELFGICRSAGFVLFHCVDFPTLKIGRRLLVTHDALMQWLKEDAAKKSA